jgi:hypothetical protein
LPVATTVIVIMSGCRAKNARSGRDRKARTPAPPISSDHPTCMLGIAA